MDPRLERRLALAAAAVGGTSLLGGVGYALEAAWRAGWVGPAHASALALALGTACLAAGDALFRRSRAAAAGLSGAGLGTLYLTLYLAYDHFGWLSGAVAAVLLVGVTFVGVVQSLRHDSALVAGLGFLGGLAVPLAVGHLAAPTLPYQAWLLLLDVAVVATLLQRRWPFLGWLAVAATGIGWAAATGWAPTPVPVGIGAAGVGIAFGAGGLRAPDAARARPLIAGTLLALVAALGTLGQAPLLALGTASALLSLAQLALARQGWHGAAWATSVATATLLGLAGLWTAIVAPGASTPLLVALAALPALTTWATIASGQARDDGQVLPLGIAAAVVGATAVATAEQPELFPWLGLLLAGGALLATHRAEGLQLLPRTERPIVLPLGLLAGAGCVALGTGPAAMPIAATLALVALWSPLLGPDETRARWTSLLALPPALGAAWWHGPDALPALPVLAAAAASLHAQRLARATPEVQRVYQALTVALAVLAVPLQLDGAGWTLGWAALAAALAWAGREHPDRAVLDRMALLLVGAVTVRLVANPAVLTYHLADGTPALWVLWGYGLPLAALVATERWIGRRRPLVQAAAAGVAFAGLNLLVSLAFGRDGALQLVDVALHARVARTVGWAALGLGLLAGGTRRTTLRQLGVGLLAAVVAKVVLADLWALDGLGRAGLLGGIAVAFLVAAAVLQRRPRAVAA